MFLLPGLSAVLPFQGIMIVLGIDTSSGSGLSGVKTLQHLFSEEVGICSHWQQASILL